MHLFLSILGIFLSALLLYFNARENKSTIYLGVLFLTAGVYSFTHYALFNSKSITLTAAVLVNSGFVPLLSGPVLYLYIRSVLEDDPHLKKYDAWHLLPVLLFLAVASPFLLSSWAFKKEVAGEFISALNNRNYLNIAFLGNRWLAYIVFVFSKVMVLAYVVWSAGLLYSFQKHKKGEKVFIRQRSTIQWIKAFLCIMIIFVTGHILFMLKIFVFGNLRGFATYNNLQYFLSLGPVAILVLTFLSPGILYGLPRTPSNKGGNDIPEKSSGEEIAEEKLTQVQLEAGYLRSIGREADACMEKFQPYTNPSFNLAEFAVLLRIPVHHLSYYFREEEKQSFTDYRNEWRVRHAKKLILEGKSGEMTLEAIGMLSGFPNRDSFRTAFQRVEGVTPAVFMKRSASNP